MALQKRSQRLLRSAKSSALIAVNHNQAAKELLGDFSAFWELETEPAERRRLLVGLFEQIWAQGGRIVAVQPHEDFLPYFQAASRCRKQGKRRVPKAGATGVKPGLYTPAHRAHRSVAQAAAFRGFVARAG